MPQYVVNQTKQIAIEAETPEEAQRKVLDGEGTVISSNLGAQPRPQPPIVHGRPQLPTVPTNMKTGLPIKS